MCIRDREKAVQLEIQLSAKRLAKYASNINASGKSTPSKTMKAGGVGQDEEEEEVEDDDADCANSLDSKDSDSEAEIASVESNENSDEDAVSSSSDDDDEGYTKDGEWRPKEEMEADGPLGRLLRAVNQSDLPPVRSEWSDYIVELGMDTSGQEQHRVRKVEQLDVATGNVVCVWESVAAASRQLSIPLHVINAVLKNNAEIGGGYKWRYCKAATAAKSTADVSLLSPEFDL